MRVLILFAFTVTEYSDYFEMEISESPRVNVFYQGAVLFHKGQVLFSNRPADTSSQGNQSVAFGSAWKEILAI